MSIETSTSIVLVMIMIVLIVYSLMAMSSGVLAVLYYVLYKYETRRSEKYQAVLRLVREMKKREVEIETVRYFLRKKLHEKVNTV